MSLLDKLKKNSKIKESIELERSSIFDSKDFITTDVPILNLALSGDIDGGLTSGLTFLAAPTKHFKTSYALYMAKAYQDKFPDGVILFYDSEFGSPQGYWKSFGIDISRVLHTPITNVEQLKFDLMAQLDSIEKKDNVFILIDSIGNLASKKEVEDALEEKSVADMSRAKQLKSLFRMITPLLKMKDIPCIAINHTYQEQGMFPKTIMGGGTGGAYSADTIFFIGKSQNKKGNEIEGFNFTITIDKSRFVQEKSKFEIEVSWEEGIKKYSGLLPIALEGGYVTKPSNGFYCRTHIQDDKKVRESATLTKEFWEPIFNDTDFKLYCKKRYSIDHIIGLEPNTEIPEESNE